MLQGVDDELGMFSGLVRSIDARDLEAPTRCSGWTVRDVAAHVVGTVVDVTAGRLEGQGTPVVTERQASERRSRGTDELADELDEARPPLTAMLGALPSEMWAGPSLTDPTFTLGFAVEALWYDAYVHGEDLRAAVGLSPARGAGLWCAVNHVAGYLEQRGWQPTTLRLDGLDTVAISGGGTEIVGDPLDFVLAATGRLDPSMIRLDRSINIYTDV